MITQHKFICTEGDKLQVEQPQGMDWIALRLTTEGHEVVIVIQHEVAKQVFGEIGKQAITSAPHIIRPFEAN